MNIRSKKMDENQLRKEFLKDWSPTEWYTGSQIAAKLKTDCRTVKGWHDPGLRRKDGNGFIILKMVKLAEKSARGEWVVDFLVERNLHGY
jgi:hypothetical protein